MAAKKKKKKKEAPRAKTPMPRMAEIPAGNKHAAACSEAVATLKAAKDAMTARDEAIVALIKEGHGDSAIARVASVSPSRISEIRKREGLVKA